MATKNNKLFAGMAPAVTGIFGALLGTMGGALVTGHFMIKSQKVQEDIILRELSGTSARQELSYLREKSLDYFVLLMQLKRYLSDPIQNESKIFSHWDKIEQAGYAVMFYSGPKLGSKSLGLNKKVAETIGKVGTDEFKQAIKELDGAIAGWFYDYFMEVINFQAHTMPKSFKQDFMEQLIQGMQEFSSKKSGSSSGSSKNR